MFPELTRDDVFRLETRRLWLRWPRQADVAALVRHAGEKSVAEMTAAIPHPYAPEAAEAFVIESRRTNTEGRGLLMAVTPRAKPGSLIGMVGIGPCASGTPQISFWLGLPHWGEGYGTEAVRALVDAFFAYTPHADLVSCARVINPGSKRVLEKCGFAFQGSGLEPFPARGGVFPVDHFRLDRRAWKSLKTWGATGFVPQREAEGAAVEASTH
jgi:RimJ/RimL family protein N-acetyltransferase